MSKPKYRLLYAGDKINVLRVVKKYQIDWNFIFFTNHENISTTIICCVRNHDIVQTTLQNVVQCYTFDQWFLLAKTRLNSCCLSKFWNRWHVIWADFHISHSHHHSNKTTSVCKFVVKMAPWTVDKCYCLHNLMVKYTSIQWCVWNCIHPKSSHLLITQLKILLNDLTVMR